MATMQIFVKEVGQQPRKVEVSPSTTIADLRTQLALSSSNVKVRLRQQAFHMNKTLETCGVKAGDTLTIFINNAAPKGFSSYAAYRANTRLKTGQCARSYNHPELARQTQEVVMRESAMLSQQMTQMQTAMHEKLEQLGEKITKETVPLEKRQEEWIVKLTPLTVANLNTMLTKQGMPTKGNKTLKVLALSKLDPHTLDNFMQGLSDEIQPLAMKAEPAPAEGMAVEEEKKAEEGKKAEEVKKVEEGKKAERMAF